MQLLKEIVSAYFKPPTLEYCSGSVCFFISVNAGYIQYNGVVMTVEQTSWMRPCGVWCACEFT